MATLKLHYEGWLALPTGLRQKLGLKSGDQLEAELVRGTIVLRRAGRPTSPQVLPDEPEAEPERAAAPIAGEAKPMPAAAPAKALPAARRTTRKPTQAILPTALKSRGRRKVKKAAEGPTADPDAEQPRR
jgi:bifunctional DNA-binding transcriptional regulator/antitoxin component of YhaV-PrlF toxin-antitoxin module